MPLRTETIDLESEAADLEADLEELRERALEHDDLPDAIEAAGEQLQTQLRGVQWAQEAHLDEDVDVWDEPAEAVILGGLTGGEFAKVEDTIAADVVARGHDGPTKGANRVHLVAEGTVEAPYHDPDASLQERVAAAASLPLAYQKWVKARVNTLTTVGEGNGKSFAASVKEKRRQTSTER